MTTGAEGRQGVFDFSDVIVRRKGVGGKYRPHYRPEECVPKEQVALLQEVRVLCGIRYSEITELTGLKENFLSKVMTLDQGVIPEEFRMIKLALADLVFRKIAAAGRK